MKRIGIIATSGPSFVQPIAAHLGKRYDIRQYDPRTDDIGAFVHSSDLVWCDWCDAIAVEATRHALCPVVIRCHSYELFSDFPTHIDWKKVRRLIFTTNYSRDFFIERFRKIPVPHSVIRKGFDAPTSIPERCWTPSVCALGGLNFKKGMTRLLDAFHAIHRRDPQYQFHIAGEMAGDLRYAAAINDARRKGLQIQFHGQIAPADLRKWLGDKAIFLSTSPWEVDPMSVRDAVAAGCFPLVRLWPGAETLYPARWLWETDADLLEGVEAAESTILFGEPETNILTNIGEMVTRCAREKELAEIDAIIDGIIDVPYEVRPWPVIAEDSEEQPRISLAMLTCNREGTIERALASVRDVADEAVILDSGSTDGTLEIARRWGCRIFHRDWTGFADQRNHAASLCRGEWVYVCDSDDFLAEAGDLRKTMLNATEQTDAVSVQGDQYGPTGLQEQCAELLAYKKDRCHYIYSIHNQLRGLKVVAMANARSVSDYIENLQDKLDRTVPQLLAGHAASPDDGHHAFFLSRSYWAQGMADETIEWCRWVTDHFPRHTGYCAAWTWLFFATLKRDGMDAASEVVKTALHYHPKLCDLRYAEMIVAFWRWFNAGKGSGYEFTTQQSLKYLGYVPKVSEALGFPLAFREEKASEVVGVDAPVPEPD